MKYILILFLFFSGICVSQIINFPDPNFKARLLAANTTNGYACLGATASGCLPGVIDANGNGEIEVSEAQSVAMLFASGANISDLSGIEYFINLEQFDCIFNNLSSINLASLTKLKVLNLRKNFLTSIDVSNQTFLETLSIPENQITTLNISNNSNLLTLFCHFNQLTSLDFSNNPLLQRVYCGNNLISNLDFSYNPNFNDLGCRNNPNLTTIKLKNGITQLFPPATWYNECWTNIPNLNYICADSNEIAALQSFLTGCGVTQSITIDSNCPLLDVTEQTRTTFVLHPNPASNQVTFTYQDIDQNSSLQVYDIMGRKVASHSLTGLSGSLTIPVSSYSNGIYFVTIQNERGILLMQKLVVE